MRILLVDPCHGGGSLPPYLNVLTHALRRHGVRVDHIGSSGVPYDVRVGAFWSVDRILAAAHATLDGVDLAAYDLISLHFGNLEIEQLVPTLWPVVRQVPVVYHVHSLDWTLFTEHVPEPSLRTNVEAAVCNADGYVFFGEYARHTFVRQFGVQTPSTVAWLPTTIPPGTRPYASPRVRPALDNRDGRTLASLYGYAAPWKDAGGLAAALARTVRANRVVLAGPLWDNPGLAGTDLSPALDRPVRHGAGELMVVSTYVDAAARQALVMASDVGLFPYRPQSTFQGSGAVADYLANGVPVLATNVANMRELVAEAGIVVPPDDIDALACALDRAGDAATRQVWANAARDRAGRFTAEHHAAQCLRLYQTVLDRRIRGGIQCRPPATCSSPVTARPIATIIN